MDEEGEEEEDEFGSDSEGEIGMREMIAEGLLGGPDAGASSDDSEFDSYGDSEAGDGSSGLTDGESSEDEVSEDSFEAKHGEPRFEVIEEEIKTENFKVTKPSKHQKSKAKSQDKSKSSKEQESGSKSKKEKKERAKAEE